MIQTTTGLFAIGWRVALALVAGSSLLTTIGVWALARFTSVFDAYAGERAKLLAQFHNLDRLVEQTDKLTATAETIKARVSDEVWDRQQRWLKRLDCYVDVVGRLEAFADATNELRVIHQQFSAYPETHDEVHVHLLTKRSEALEKYNLAVSAFTRSRTAAGLICAKEPLIVLRKFVLPRFDFTNLDDVLEQSGKLASVVSATFVAAARSDLGYEPRS